MPNLILLSAAAAEHTAGPQLFGLGPVQIVSISMLTLILIMLWKKVPGVIAGGLDAKIALIREQLGEATKLREEADALRKEYAAKIKGAEKDAKAMVDAAAKEAESILAKAEADSKEMIERRKKMAEDKIAAAEREAIAEVQAKVATAAAAASQVLIAGAHDAKADAKMADSLIAGL